MTLVRVRNALDILSGGAGGTRTPNPFPGSRFQGGFFIQPGLLHGLLSFNFTNCMEKRNTVLIKDFISSSLKHLYSGQARTIKQIVPKCQWKKNAWICS